MQISLIEFEKIDGLMASLLRMGPFETCSDPREYIRTSNRLLDACIDATSLAFVDDFASVEECAAHIVTLGLLGSIEVLDEEAA
jgi:hypothetical protein